MTDRDKIIKASGLEGIPINKRISQSHPYGDEIAILRKAVFALANGQPLPQEFTDYYNEAEAVKAEVKQELEMTGGKE